MFNTTLGSISLIEARVLRDGHRICPFVHSARIKQRGYSKRVQKLVSSLALFGSFADVSKLMREQHSLEIGCSACRALTEATAKRASALEAKRSKEAANALRPCAVGSCSALISESDGVMVPVVDTGRKEKRDSQDLRKHRTVCWKEARVSATARVGQESWIYASSFGDLRKLVQDTSAAAFAIGYQVGTPVYVIGDGALWIQEWAEACFGTDRRQTVDFFHLMEYVSAAATFTEFDQVVWRDALRQEALSGNIETVVLELPGYPRYAAQEGNALHDLWRYVQNRPGQFDYQELRKHGLPIGSGKIESTNRELVQKRLKLPGAWWHQDTLPRMLSLLTTWMNDSWEDLWDEAA